MLPAACRRATRIIADSHNTRDDLVRLFEIERNKVDVIHLGVGERFRNVADEDALAGVRARYALPEHFALYLGALEPRKNLTNLIDAFALLRDRGLRQPLVIAGSGDTAYESVLAARARASGAEVGRDVVFTGHVAEADLPSIYSASEVFVFPSRYEGFGLPPLEAMACQVPVVLARNSSLSEVFEGSCFLFDGHKPGAIADAVEVALIDTQQINRRVLSGLDLARGRNWQRVCEETAAVYERALSESKYST